MGEGTQELERPSRDWERGRKAEKMETEETKMKHGTQMERLSFRLWVCAQGTALQAPRRFLHPPAASPGDMQDLLGRSKQFRL